MHVILEMPNGGQIWLGGLRASGQVPVMVQNGIAAIVSCQKAAPPVKDSRMKVLGEVDGVGLLAGQVPVSELGRLMAAVSSILEQGQKVLFACGSGSYRAGLVCACQLLFLTQSEPDVVVSHIQSLRNVVNFGQVPTGGRASEYEKLHCRPIPSPWAWLLENKAILAGLRPDDLQQAQPVILNYVRTPSQFRLMALNSGAYKQDAEMVALRPKAKAKAAPGAARVSDTEARLTDAAPNH